MKYALTSEHLYQTLVFAGFESAQRMQQSQAPQNSTWLWHSGGFPPERFKKLELRGACSLNAIARGSLQPFLHNALIQLGLIDVTPDLSQHLSSIVGSRQQRVHPVHRILADPALGR